MTPETTRPRILWRDYRDNPNFQPDFAENFEYIDGYGRKFQRGTSPDKRQQFQCLAFGAAGAEPSIRTDSTPPGEYEAFARVFTSCDMWSGEEVIHVTAAFER